MPDDEILRGIPLPAGDFEITEDGVFKETWAPGEEPDGGAIVDPRVVRQFVVGIITHPVDGDEAVILALSDHLEETRTFILEPRTAKAVFIGLGDTLERLT